MKALYIKQIKKIEKKEQKILNQKEKNFIGEKFAPITHKIQDKIPIKLKSALNTAFYKGFQLVFEKGNGVIEKTYNKERIKKEYDVNNYTIEKLGPSKHLKKIDKQSSRSRRVNTVIATVEGTGLGLLGLGLPDIPLFTSMLLKNIYEIALSYGFDYESEEEKIYILSLINGSIFKGERQRLYDSKLDQIASYIDWNCPLNVNLQEQMKETSDNLAEVMLLGKYIQGLFIVGVYGGIQNFNLMNKISRYAKLKYKKRYLQRKC